MTSSKMHDPARRHLLRATAGLGLAGSFLSCRTALADSHLAEKSSAWRFDQLQPAPEQRAWNLLDSHDRGHFDDSWEDPSHSNYSRIKLESAPDGMPSFCHVVKKRQIVDPVGHDSAPISTDFSSISIVLLRYHHWIETPSYLPGKWIALQLGQGWVGTGHPQDAGQTYGYDGGSATCMHPARDGGNGIRLLTTHTRQRSAYGSMVGRGADVLPTGRWLTIDVVVDRYSGYRLYVDGVMAAMSSSVTPIGNWNACRAIWYRNRLMHGGTPRLLPALTDYREWFGGFFVGAV